VPTFGTEAVCSDDGAHQLVVDWNAPNLEGFLQLVPNWACLHKPAFLALVFVLAPFEPYSEVRRSRKNFGGVLNSHSFFAQVAFVIRISTYIWSLETGHQPAQWLWRRLSFERYNKAKLVHRNGNSLLGAAVRGASGGRPGPDFHKTFQLSAFSPLCASTFHNAQQGVTSLVLFTWGVPFIRQVVLLHLRERQAQGGRAQGAGCCGIRQPDDETGQLKGNFASKGDLLALQTWRWLGGRPCPDFHLTIHLSAFSPPCASTFHNGPVKRASAIHLCAIPARRIETFRNRERQFIIGSGQGRRFQIIRDNPTWIHSCHNCIETTGFV
jgi:hypothetical protein